MGCRITVTMEGDDILSVEGNTCKRGFLYATNEVKSPVRTVTTTIKVTGGLSDRVSCKTKEAVPKDKIFEVMEAINKASCKAPVAIGDVLIEDCAGTGIPVVATKAVTSV
jgi:CxxC motif-containing protein